MKFIFVFFCFFMFSFGSDVLVKLVDKDISLNDFKKEEINMFNDNHFVLKYEDKKDELLFVSFDDYPLDLIDYKDGIKTFVTSYEVCPTSNIKVVSHLKNGESFESIVDFKYSLNNRIKFFKTDWDTSNDKFFIRKNLIVDGSKYFDMSFNKVFDEDINFNIEFKPIEVKNVDMKISIGDRIYFSFNNKRVDVYLKEKENGKYKLVKTELINNFHKFKENNNYSIKLNTLNHNKYILEITDVKNKDNNIKVDFEDFGKNKIEYERYKELKLMFRTMKIEILNIEIK